MYKQNLLNTLQERLADKIFYSLSLSINYRLLFISSSVRPGRFLAPFNQNDSSAKWIVRTRHFGPDFYQQPVKVHYLKKRLCAVKMREKTLQTN